MSYVDLHLHLLPAVDDGAQDLAQALRYAARMAADGIRDAAVTPHVGHPDFPVEVGSLPERTAALQQALNRHKVGLRLHTGGEIRFEGAARLSDAELDVVALGPTHRRWVLLEAPFGGIDRRFVETASIMQRRGYGVVIAHPERSAGMLGEGLPLLRTLVLSGAVLQVNACSLLGVHGRRIRAKAQYLLRTRLAYILGSDAHPGRREHTLQSGYGAAVRAGISPAQARQLTQANPRFLLTHGLPGPVESGGRPSWRSPRAREVAAVLRASRRR